MGLIARFPASLSSAWETVGGVFEQKGLTAASRIAEPSIRDAEELGRARKIDELYDLLRTKRELFLQV
jgi:hypothetical protein